jgi:ABC-type glycerol-3-phosphate transport system permease component
VAKSNSSFSATVRRIFKPGLKRQELVIRLVAWFLCTVMAVLIMMPVGWMLSTALKTRFEAISFPPRWIPAIPQWQNFVEALTFGPWGHYFLNTLFYAGMVMLGEVLSSSFIAYAFAHLRAPGKNALFVFVLGSVMLSMWVTIVPQYIMFSKIGWLNSYLPLILPHWFGSPYLIFILRQFYRTIPRDYIEAALIDGANHIGIWWRIMLPLSTPALGAVGVGSFLYFYQDFIGPLIYLNDNKKFTVSLGLVQFEGAFGDVPWNLWMAASFAALIPPTILFFIAQRYFVQGIVISGVKG